MPVEAVVSLERGQTSPGQGFGSLITAYLAAGRRSEALRLRAEVERTARRGYVSPVSLAVAHFAFGEEDAGFRELERALALKDQSLATLKMEPAYDGIRSDPRFQQILARLRL
jgi:hypothetical protein